MMYSKEQIASILKKIREHSGYTQKDVAKLINKAQQTIASWEIGQSQPDANTLFELCKIYGVSVDEAFGFKTQKLSPLENELLTLFSKLNEIGQSKVINIITDMLEIKRYVTLAKLKRESNCT